MTIPAPAPAETSPDRCTTCTLADPRGPDFPPEAWARVHGAPWYSDVWVCRSCQRHYRLGFHQHEMIYDSVELLPDAARALLEPDIDWTRAWSFRTEPHPLVGHYLALYLQCAELPWSELAEAVVTDTLREAVSAPGLSYLHAVFANVGSALESNTRPERAKALLDRCAAWRADAGGDPELEQAFRRFVDRAEQTCAILSRRAEAQVRHTAAREAAAAAPRAPRPLILGYTERIPGPEPVEKTAIDRPGAAQLARAALAKVRARPWRYGAPVAICVLAMEVFGPNIPGIGPLLGFAIFPMCVMSYMATASLVAGRWQQPLWKLTVDRFGMVLQSWAALALAVPAWLLLMGLIVLIIPDEVPTPRSERSVGYAALLLAAVRAWPIVATPFVYRGYVFYEAISVGENWTWIGAGLRTAFRISGQPGFLARVTLPLLLVVALLVALLELAEFALWMRGVMYVVALPLLAQFADQAVDRWRIPTGDPGVDRG